MRISDWSSDVCSSDLVCGYLITTAHIYTLGLYGLVDFSKDYFLLEGSKFVLVLVIGISQAVINPVTILAATVLAPIALAVIFARGPLARTWKRLPAWHAPHAGSSWRTGGCRVRKACCSTCGTRWLAVN